MRSSFNTLQEQKMEIQLDFEKVTARNVELLETLRKREAQLKELGTLGGKAAAEGTQEPDWNKKF